YGTAIAELQDFRRGEVLVVISHSGVNPVQTQPGQHAQPDGLTVVAITSCAHSRSGRSRHPDGLRLLDVADLVLDTHAPTGDITLALGDGTETGPTSTIIATMLLHSLATGAMEQLRCAGTTPPVLTSMNRSGGDDSNKTVLRPYLARLCREPCPSLLARRGPPLLVRRGPPILARRAPRPGRPPLPGPWVPSRPAFCPRRARDGARHAQCPRRRAAHRGELPVSRRRRPGPRPRGLLRR